MKKAYEELAVYGTLKEGFWNNPLLGDSELIGKGFTLEKMAITSLRGVPMVFREPTIGHIAVDLYHVPTDLLKSAIDRLESNGYVYNRAKTPVRTYLEGAGTRDTEAWLYFGMRKFDNHDWPKPNSEFEGMSVLDWGT